MSLRSLQSVIGFLTFVCKSVAPGHTVLRRLIDLIYMWDLKAMVQAEIISRCKERFLNVVDVS